MLAATFLIALTHWLKVGSRAHPCLRVRPLTCGAQHPAPAPEPPHHLQGSNDYGVHSVAQLLLLGVSPAAVILPGICIPRLRHAYLRHRCALLETVVARWLNLWVATHHSLLVTTLTGAGSSWRQGSQSG